MSEIYLTKIERKTIFTKSLIFVLIMFVISDLTVTGPFYFNFIPWIYILGTMGSVKKIDSILMGIICTFTVFVSSLIAQGGCTNTTIVCTFITLVLLIFGIITGKIIYNFILEHRLVKYIHPRKKIIYILSIISMLIISFILTGINGGNLITYLKSKNNLQQYITKTYGVNDFKIITTKYNKQVAGNYVYMVNMQGQDIYFVPVTQYNFKDANRDERLDALNNKLKEETSVIVKETLKEYALLNDTSITYDLEYTNVGVIPDSIVMRISCISHESSLKQLYTELSECIIKLQEKKQAHKVVINIDNNILEISKQHIYEISSEYIKDGLDIEQID